MEAIKGPRTLIVEAKGEPKSRYTYKQERQEFIRSAFASIIQYMREENLDRAYCIAVPNNEYYSRRTRELIPELVRMKLGLNILFVDEKGSLHVLLPAGMKIRLGTEFDSLFDAGYEVTKNLGYQVTLTNWLVKPAAKK